MTVLRRVIPVKDATERLEKIMIQLVTARTTDKQEIIDYLRELGYSQLNILQAIQKLKTAGKIVEEEPPPEGGSLV